MARSKLANKVDREHRYSYSRRRAFATCPRLHHFRYTEGWKQIQVDEKLRFGSAFHRAVELHWGGASLARVELEVSGVAADPWLAEKVMATFTAYLTYHESDDAQYSVVTVDGEPLIECEFLTPMLDANMGFVPDAHDYGFIDKVVQDEDGKIYLWETKTTSLDLSVKSTYWKSLLMNPQVSGYYMGALGELCGPGGLRTPVGCVFDVIKRLGTRPQKTTPLENRKFKKRTKAQIANGLPENDSSLLYKGMRLEDETPDEFGIRCLEQIQENPSEMFKRVVIFRTDDTLREHCRDSAAFVKLIQQCNTLDTSPKNPAACHLMGTCDMWAACSANVNPGELPELYYKENN